MMKVIIPTCDKYLWIAPTFLHFYKKNWPDNPYQTEYVTEIIKVEGVPTFCVGKLPWADRIMKYLAFYKEEKFLLILDDCVLTSKVDTVKIKEAEKLCTGSIGCVRLSANSTRRHFLFDVGIPGFKEYPLDKPYLISTQAAFWQKDFFLDCLKKGESIWQTETEGSKRICKSKKRVISSDVPIISHHHGGYIRKGKIVKSVSEWIKENW